METGTTVTEKEVKEFEAYKKLYDTLTDFGQRPDTPLNKLDYVKARVFDTTVLINRIKGRK